MFKGRGSFACRRAALAAGPRAALLACRLTPAPTGDARGRPEDQQALRPARGRAGVVEWRRRPGVQPVRDVMAMDAATGSPSRARHPADAHDVIRVQGARENNLKNISLEIPKRRLTVFTGVSGSGKSSLVFDTIAAEAQRLMNETYSAFIQGFLPTTARPDVDVLEGLTPAIIVDQLPMGGGVRSTVGTATDAHALLRILFSRLGEPHIGPPSAFSFNVATARGAGAVTVERGEGRGQTDTKTFEVVGGMCPRCEGTGTVTGIDPRRILD